MTEPSPEGRRRFSLELSLSRLAHIDALKKEWGLRNRGDVLERLLEDLFSDSAEEDIEPEEDGGALARSAAEEDLNEQTALVLFGDGTLDSLEATLEGDPPPEGASAQGSRGGAVIDLPGFVQRRSDQLKQGLRRNGPARAKSTATFQAPLPSLGMEVLHEALAAARDHWLELYGKPANDTVLEAAMIWLGKDIWRQSDAAEGRPFTWTAANRTMREWVPAWSEGPPSFEKVMVIAGVLEDPFSATTLPLRIPTLIRRFVGRFRRRRSGTSFQTLENTMTLRGALQLLQLPTDPGQRVTLGQIREAYRLMALSHHPDSGGSVEAMRRLNEAYQLLKELYRQRGDGAL